MPKKFVKAVKGIEKAIKAGKIPKYYYKGGKRHKTSAYAIARTATGYYGTTHDIGLIRKRKKKIKLKGGLR